MTVHLSQFTPHVGSSFLAELAVENQDCFGCKKFKNAFSSQQVVFKGLWVTDVHCTAYVACLKLIGKATVNNHVRLALTLHEFR